MPELLNSVAGGDTELNRLSAASATSAAANYDGATFRSAGTSLTSHVRVWGVAILGLAIDLWSKNWAVQNLEMHHPRVIIQDIFSLRLSLNPGALFGIGAGWAPIFIGASVLALLFVIYLFWQSTPRQWCLHLALGCVLGGAIGNLYDRSFVTAYVVELRDGRRDVCQIGPQNPAPGEVWVGDFGTGKNPRRYILDGIVRSSTQPVVRDFLSIEWRVGGRSIWPWVFNIADALLVVGVGVLLVNFWFGGGGRQLSRDPGVMMPDPSLPPSATS